ncbi:hypothetical protein GCG54_00006503 [Colletotrichum gloeosporioides]|uniref:Uncharacterized protein n=1 Tax=Colletotrichum gloeosporioides TaxID=474922 RepID=A0A8H4FNH5_COLGL|nr:uncharacterized protein GCG54_00006503 [Colletotrichum gloeosporioides]KAF3808637.1 hypothetical protein GCG54_00006503 [Colletotrichum gloeosporioides]
MASKKKNMGKNQRDRLKKQKNRSLVPTNAPSSFSPDGTDTDADSTHEKTTLDVTNYSAVSKLSTNLRMSNLVKERVSVDDKGRKLRVIMGGEKDINEFIKRLEDEAKLQTQLTRISTRFNALRSSQPDDPEVRKIGNSINGLMASTKGLIFDAGGARKRSRVPAYPGTLKLALDRENPMYDALSLQMNAFLALEDIAAKIEHVRSRVREKDDQ